MNEKKQITQTSDTAITPGRFWGTIVTGAILMLVAAYGDFLVIQNPASVFRGAQIIFLTLLLAFMIASIILTIRGRQVLAANIIFFSVQALIL